MISVSGGTPGCEPINPWARADVRFVPVRDSFVLANRDIIRSSRNYRVGVGEPINSPMFRKVFSQRRDTLTIKIRRPDFVGRGSSWFPKVPSDLIDKVML